MGAEVVAEEEVTQSTSAAVERELLTVSCHAKLSVLLCILRESTYQIFPIAPVNYKCPWHKAVAVRPWP